MDSKDEIKPKAEIKPKFKMDSKEQSTSNQHSTSYPSHIAMVHPIITEQYDVRDFVYQDFRPLPDIDSKDKIKPKAKFERKEQRTDLKITDQLMFSTKSTTACSSKTIGPNGGRIEVGGCALIVPAGALDEDIHITLTASLDLDNQTKRILTPTLRCEPPSLEFKLPVTIFLQTHYILDEELLAECKIQTSEDGINWSILQTDLSYIGRLLVFTINHFTCYEGLCNWIKGKIDIVSSIYMRSKTELVWAIHYNLDLNTEQPSGNCLAKFTHCIWANKDLTLTIEEDENPETIKIRPRFTKINHADLTTKFNQHTPFFIEELPDKDVYLNAILRNEDEPRWVLFKLQKQRPSNQSTASSNTGKNNGHTVIIMDGVDANNSALFSNKVGIGKNKIV